MFTRGGGEEWQRSAANRTRFAGVRGSGGQLAAAVLRTFNGGRKGSGGQLATAAVLGQLLSGGCRGRCCADGVLGDGGGHSGGLPIRPRR